MRKKTVPVYGISLLLLCLFSGGAVQAQSNTRFEASRHLKGFDEVSFSEYGYLYELKRFEARDGMVLTAQELDEIRAEWARVKTQVAAEIERIEKSPYAYSLHLLDRQLSRHRVFSKLTFTKELSTPPVALYIQDLLKPVPKYRERVVARYGPLLKEAADVFDREYAAPLGLKPRKGHQACVLIVLASWGDFTNYMNGTSRRGFYTNGAFYDHDLRAGVTYSDVFAISKNPEAVKRRSALFTAALSLVHAHRSSTDLPTANAWLFDGIAETLSRRAADGLGIDPKLLSDSALKDLAAMLSDPAQRDIYFLSAHELLASATQTKMYRTIQPRAVRENLPEAKWWPRALGHYQRQAGVLVHFLREGAGGRYRERFHTCLKGALVQKGPAQNGPAETGPAAKGSEALTGLTAEALTGLTADALHAEHVTFFAALLKRRCPGVPLRPSDREALLARVPASGSGKTTTAKGTARKTTGYVKSSFDPKGLASGRFPPDITLGLALHEARAGRIESGLERIENLLVSRLKDDRELRDLATRETSRLKRLLEFRATFLEACAESGKKLRIVFGGRTLNGSVEKVADGSFAIRKNASTSTTVPVDALDAAQLLKAARSRKIAPVEDWLLGYLALVADNRIWRKYAKSASPEAALLRDDAPAIESGLRKTEAHAAILALARTPLPADTTDALALLERIGALFADHGDSEALAEKKADICQFAGQALALIYDAKDPAERLAELKGQVDDLGGGKIRITYEFDDPAELGDFESIDYLEELRESLPALKTGKEESTFEIRKGSLVCKGVLCLRLKVGFKAPLQAEYQLVWSTLGYETAETLPHGWVFVGLCDDGFGSCIKCVENGNLEGYDKRANFWKKDWNDWVYDGDTRYTIRVVHDGRTVESHVDGKLENSIACGPRREGNVFLWINHDIFVKVKRFVVEGVPDKQSLHRMREQWILDRVAALDE